MLDTGTFSRSIGARDARERQNAAEMEPILPLRVLLVEDSPYIRERLEDLLAEPGRIKVEAHADTEEGAIALLDREAWDVLVLDLQLRRGTGLGVLRALMRVRRPETKVIVLTNYAFPQYRERSLSLGADYFFDKAREYHRVREVLDGMLGTRMSEGR